MLFIVERDKRLGCIRIKRVSCEKATPKGLEFLFYADNEFLVATKINDDTFKEAVVKCLKCKKEHNVFM